MLLYVDINDACHLRCGTCPRGVRAFPNSNRMMSLGTFRQIVRKGLHDGAYQVGLFNWVEPFLIPRLDDYTQIVKSFGLRCEIASTLSLRKIDRLVETLANVDLLWVTMSGYSQAVYEVNHAGGRIEDVFAHLESIAAARREGRIATQVLLRYLMFDYNRDEMPLMRDFAEERGFRFEVLLGSGHPVHMRASDKREAEIAAALAAYNASRYFEPAGTVCPLIFEHVPVNADGDVYQCSAHGYHPQLRIGSYLDLGREEILMRRYMQPFCNSCDWARRAITETERLLLRQALEARMGNVVTDRVARLSGPDAQMRLTEDGYQLPKDGRPPLR